MHSRMLSVMMSCDPYMSSPAGIPMRTSWASRHSRNADVRLLSASDILQLLFNLNRLGARLCLGAVVAGTGRINEPGLQVSQQRRETVTLQRGQSSLEHASDGDADRGSIREHSTNRP